MRFSKAEFSSRGAAFERVEQRLKDILQKEDEKFVEVTEGIDDLCQACPDRRDERCESPQGNEEAVRKWDRIILKGLEVSYGETRTSKEWRTLIEQKAPLHFCATRCPAKSSCAVPCLD